MKEKAIDKSLYEPSWAKVIELEYGRKSQMHFGHPSFIKEPQEPWYQMNPWWWDVFGK